jgi:hypothetical protein
VATAVRVGTDLGWPLARDEPVVRLDPLHYLFTLPADKDGTFLNYGVSFNARRQLDHLHYLFAGRLASLQRLLLRAFLRGGGPAVQGLQDTAAAGADCCVQGEGGQEGAPAVPRRCSGRETARPREARGTRPAAGDSATSVDA